MYEPLIPCLSCARHVRASESSCPFCGAVVPEGSASRAIPSAPRRLGRAATFMFGASLAAAGCSSAAQPADGETARDAPADEGSIVLLYGVPVDAQTDSAQADVQPDAAVDTGPSDDGSNIALYGDPLPIDVAPTDAADDEGGSVLLYGVPPPIDAG